MKTKLTTETYTNLFSGMTREELRALATRFNIPRGKNRSDTVKNLVKAVSEQKIKFTTRVEIKTMPSETSKYGDLVYSRKLRNHKDDKVLFPIVADNDLADAKSLAVSLFAGSADE